MKKPYTKPTLKRERAHYCSEDDHKVHEFPIVLSRSGTGLMSAVKWLVFLFLAGALALAYCILK